LIIASLKPALLMKKIKNLVSLLILSYSLNSFSQFTDVINSNRPGESMTAYSVGKTVFQMEGGTYYIDEQHALLNNQIQGMGLTMDFRFGYFLEELEFILNTGFQYDQYTEPLVNETRSGVKNLTFGAKYLIYDPFKYYKEKVNILSWKANQKFKWRQLLPAVSGYAGVNFSIGDTYNYVNEPVFGPKIMIITQQQLNPHIVLVTNFFYNDFLSDYKNYGFIATLTYGFNERWSCFIEDKGIQGDYYADNIFSFGAAYLIKQNLQVDASISRNFKDTPEIVYGGIGFSWRFDKNYKPVELKDKNVDDNEKTKGDKKRDKQKEETKKRLEEEL
jgi:hypothetical protein